MIYAGTNVNTDCFTNSETEQNFDVNMLLLLPTMLLFIRGKITQSIPATYQTRTQNPKSLSWMKRFLQNSKDGGNFFLSDIWYTDFGAMIPSTCVSIARSGSTSNLIQLPPLLLNISVTNHTADYMKFYAKVYLKQNELSKFKNVISANRKPFLLCQDLLDFFNSSGTPIKQLNYIIDHLLPFYIVKSESFRELTAGTGRKRK